MGFYKKIPIRTRIALLTILIWLAVPYAFWQYQHGKPDYLSFCLRGGLIMAIFWLAWPEVEKLPKWIFLALPFAAVIAVWRPMFLIYLIPIYFIVKILNFILFELLAPLPNPKNQQAKDAKSTDKTSNK